MNVTVVPLTDFVHGSINAREGRPIEMEEYQAKDLERNGLVRIRFTQPTNSVPGKPVDDGRGPPSSASPAAPVSPMTTSSVLKRGPGRPPKTEGS